MPPKKSSAAATKKAPGAPPAHGSYLDMIKDAIINLKDRNGSSRQGIQKYIKANNTLGDVSDAMFKSHVNRAIISGEKNGDFTRPKGASGPVKLAKKESKPAVVKKSEIKAKPEKKTTEKKAAAKPKKATTVTKAKTTAGKPVAVKKTKATAAKKATAKPKANASKPRKTATAAPAVDKEVSRVLGKTKSGRVTKTKAPAAAASKPKKAATTKKTAAKKATPKKATPKKAEA